MKPSIYCGLILALALGGCTTVYQTGQTPDDVYYSPSQQRSVAYSSSADQFQTSGEAATPSDTGGNYVTYSDGSSYAPPSDSYYDYGYSDPYYYPGSYYMDNYFGYGLGLGWGGLYSPFASFWYPSLSLGFMWGSPWLSAYYSPWMYGWYGSPYYSYGGFYPGYYGKYYGYATRPANSYGPRIGLSSTGYYHTGSTTPSTNGSAPVRTFNPGGVSRPNNGVYTGGRVFTPSNGTGVRQVNISNRPGLIQRVFRPVSQQRPVQMERPVETSRPAREFQPSRSYDFAPRASFYGGGGGGGRSFSPRGR